MKKPKIMVVDDNVELCTSVANFLRNRLDCDVVEKFSSPEAMAVLDADTVDVLIQDLQMPLVDGSTVIKRAKERNPDVTAVLITGLSAPQKIRDMESLNVIYLPKPFEMMGLLTIVQRELVGKGIAVIRKPA